MPAPPGSQRSSSKDASPAGAPTGLPSEGANGARAAPVGSAHQPASPAPPHDHRDRALVEAVKQGKPGAWTDLLKIYQDRVYSLCLRTAGNPDLAADLAQDTMVKLVQHIDKYDGRCQFFTWVYRITLNTCLTRLRSEKLRRMAPLDAIEGDGASFQVPDRPGSAMRSIPSVRTEGGAGELRGVERVEHMESRSAVLRAMQSLAPEHAAVLILRDAHGLEYQQIADALEVSVGTVKSRIFRARAALRDLLEGNTTNSSTD